MLCFIHIEKAAGTSFHEILKQHIPDYLILKPHPRHGADFSPKQLKLLLFYFPEIKGVGGHRLRPYLNYESAINKEIEYITILRSPIDRYLSHYFHHINNGISNMSLNQFIEIPYFNNFMCRKICGEPSANLAIKLINQKKIKILFLEDISGFEKKNSGISSNNYSVVKESNYAKLKACNMEDLKLYEYFKKRGSDYDYFKNVIIGNTDKKISKMNNFKTRIIQEIFQRLFYQLSGRKPEQLTRGY
ncbi:MAG: hypothetical protein ABJB05_08810 [Parafilimonas sp.]